MTITLSFWSKPSFRPASRLSVCSRSSLPPPRPAPRWRPTASISSMKTIAGAAAFALLNRSRDTARAHADEHFDEFRGGDAEEGHVASPATARASMRLASAGRSDQLHAARDARAERDVLSGSLEEVAISTSSVWPRSVRPTSTKVIFGFSASIRGPGCWPKPKTPPICRCERRVCQFRKTDQRAAAAPVEQELQDRIRLGDLADNGDVVVAQGLR